MMPTRTPADIIVWVIYKLRVFVYLSQGRSQDPAAGGWLLFFLPQPLLSFLLLKFLKVT
jgi:hypothetical protein